MSLVIILEDVWTAPLGEEAVRPNPLGGHCFVKFDQRRALLFGGRYEDGRKNDTRIFDLEERVCIHVENSLYIPFCLPFA